MLPFISKGEDMRKLETPDLFGFVRLINKLGLKEDIKKMGLKASENVNPEEFGADLIFLMLEKSSTEEGEAYIYEFFAPIFEISEEDISSLFSPFFSSFLLHLSFGTFSWTGSNLLS